MAADDKLEQIVFTRVLRLNAVVQGLVVGLLLGTVIFVATNWLVLKGGPVVGPHLTLLNQFFIGYKVSLVGSLVGFAYGAVVGFVIGYVIAVLYNIAAGARERGRTPTA
jgi:tetrahydromethanopterin S-methyltransferase subunit G